MKTIFTLTFGHHSYITTEATEMFGFIRFMKNMNGPKVKITFTREKTETINLTAI